MVSAEVNPLWASKVASRPLWADRPGWKGLVIDPNTSLIPEAWVPAIPNAAIIWSADNPRILPAAIAEPNTPHVPVMCQPSL